MVTEETLVTPEYSKIPLTGRNQLPFSQAWRMAFDLARPFMLTYRPPAQEQDPREIQAWLWQYAAPGREDLRAVLRGAFGGDSYPARRQADTFLGHMSSPVDFVPATELTGDCLDIPPRLLAILDCYRDRVSSVFQIPTPFPAIVRLAFFSPRLLGGPAEKMRRMTQSFDNPPYIRF